MENAADVAKGREGSNKRDVEACSDGRRREERGVIRLIVAVDRCMVIEEVEVSILTNLGGEI